MGSALVRGLLASGWDPHSIAIAEGDASRRSWLSDSFRDVEVRDAPLAAEGTVLSVKPADAHNACRAVAEVGPTKVLSVMAGVRLARIESWLGDSVAVMRAMPNTAALVGEGASALSGGTAAGEADLLWAEGVLRAVGEVVRVPEDCLDAVTGVSGSGPAYLFYVAQALIEAGADCGLPGEVSEELVIQTFKGAARMLSESGESPEVLRERVTSPGGTTEAALRVLADRMVAEALKDAVAAATRRAGELGA
jgi:pyrroline-5-carboxylate reductase